MSKKNNRTTRANAHAFKLAKEKEEEAKRQQKQQKQQKKEQGQAGSGAAASGSKQGVKVSSLKGVLKIKASKSRIKLKKNKVVRGIKITDAESKKRAKELLAAEEAMRQMEMDALPEGDARKPKKISFATGEAMMTD